MRCQTEPQRRVRRIAREPQALPLMRPVYPEGGRRPSFERKRGDTAVADDVLVVCSGLHTKQAAVA